MIEIACSSRLVRLQIIRVSSCFCSPARLCSTGDAPSGCSSSYH